MTRWLWRASLVAYAAVWCAALLLLPERVPVHFGATGDATTFAGRGTALLLFAGLGVGTALVLGWGQRAVARGSVVWLNVPHKQWWTRVPERERRMRAMLGTDVRVVGAATMVLLAALVGATLAASGDAAPRLGATFLVVVLVYVVGVLGWSVWSHRVRFHPDRQGEA